MSRNISCFILAGLFLVSVPCAAAQKTAKVPRIGFLCAVSCAGTWHEAFRQGLRDLGYVEGKNIAIESRSAAGRTEQLADLASELVHLRVDVIVADGTSASRAAQNATGTVPIVMAVSGDVVEIGLVKSLARPGGNITGSSVMSYDLHAKILELLKETVPSISRVAILLNPANPWHEPMVKKIEALSGPLRLRLQHLRVKSPKEFESAFSAMKKERADAFIVLADTTFESYQTQLAELGQKHRLPSISLLSGYVEAGGLMTYGPNVPDLFRRAATYVDKILKGAKPANLPVEQPTKFELVINLKAAQQIGLTIPPNVLVRADKLIK